MIACYKGHYKIANFLLSLKADINKKSVKGNTALHDCAESGSLDIFKMLILNGAKMEVDSYGKCRSIILLPQYIYYIMLYYYFNSKNSTAQLGKIMN